MSVKPPEDLDMLTARVWMAYAKLGVTMHDLETVYCLADLMNFHQALDVQAELDAKLSAKAQGVERVRAKGCK